MANLHPKKRAALIVIDVQNDFCPHGALPVPGGDAVVPVINRLTTRFDHVIFTQDWHVPAHISFASAHPGHHPFETIAVPGGEQMLWPDHCVQGTEGAAFHPEVAVDSAELIVRKGFRRDMDAYSAFFENDKVTPSGLSGYLTDRGLHELYLSGLATDVCVRHSAIDAARIGFSVHVIADACRGIDTNGSVRFAWDAMATNGVVQISAAAVLENGVRE